MGARLRKWLDDLAEAFWLVPALLVIAALALAYGLIESEQRGLLPEWLISASYGGNDTGARTLLGAIASSSIGVAGTIFSVTIAALTLASTQMGPRLLSNFTRDIGNQLTLGVLLGSFAYSLLALRAVRGGESNVFVPHVALSVGIVLGLVCVGFVVYFVHHVASRINVETVIELVHADLLAGFSRLEQGIPEIGEEPPPLEDDGGWVHGATSGHVQEIDEAGLIDWAVENDVTVRLVVRPGRYLFPGVALAHVTPMRADAEEVMRGAIVLGGRAAGFADIGFAARQLVEVATRALSPGINDDYTAMRVLDRLGSGLCALADRRLPEKVVRREGRIVLVRDPGSYLDLLEMMFAPIRQNAVGRPPVLEHMIEVFSRTVESERADARLACIATQVQEIMEDARASVRNARDLSRLEAAHLRFLNVLRSGVPAV